MPYRQDYGLQPIKKNFAENLQNLKRFIALHY
jgi:hypothetical protein